jgi:hypothetical protein
MIMPKPPNPQKNELPWKRKKKKKKKRKKNAAGGD